MRAKDTKNARRNGKSGMNRLISFALAVAAAGSATLRAENPILPLWANSYTVDKATLGNGRIRLTWTWEVRSGLIISFH